MRLQVQCCGSSNIFVSIRSHNFDYLEKRLKIQKYVLRNILCLGSVYHNYNHNFFKLQVTIDQNQDQKSGSAKKGRGRPRKEINTIPPPKIQPQQIQWSKLSPEEKAVTPPTKEKNDWDELTKTEQDNWNNYGGGR